MKKIVSFVLLLIMAVVLVACGNNEEDVDPDIAIVAAVKAGLEIGYQSPDTQASVTQNLTLKTEVNGVSITWTSSNVNAISNAGVVTQTANNVAVRLTAALTKGVVEDSRIFNVTVAAKVVEGAPVILGVEEYPEIKEGDAYDPLKGVTAFVGDEDVSDTLVTTFNPDTMSSPGTYNFEITASNEDGLTTTIRVELTVNEAVIPVIVAPSAVTYYIGSKAFNPLEGVRAYDLLTGEAMEVVLDQDEYTTAVPGKYTYSVKTTNQIGKVATQTISLTVVRKQTAILAELPKNQTIEIEMWHANGKTIENELKKYGKAFEAEMLAQGYNIEVTITNNGSNYDELKTNVINALKGGQLPNIVQNYPDHVVEYAQVGAIESLTPYIQHPTHGYNSSIESEAFTDILESYRSEQRATNETGDYISLPFNKSTEVMAYNKTFFDSILKGRAFPETWQELFELEAEIMGAKDANVDEIASRWAAAGKALEPEAIQEAKDQFVPFVYDSSANAFITLLRQFGGVYTSRDASGKGSIDFVNDATTEMLLYFGEERGSLFTVPATWQASYTNEVSKYGKAVLGVGSTGGVRYNTPEEGGYKLFEIGVAPIPYDQFNPNSRSVIQQGTNISLTTEGTDAQKLASWYFIKYLTSHNVQLEFALATGYSPIRESVYTSARFEEYLSLADTTIADSAALEGLTAAEYRAKFESIVKAMGARAAAQQRDYQFYDTPFIGSSATRDAVGVAFDRVILSSKEADLVDTIIQALAYAATEALKGIPNT